MSGIHEGIQQVPVQSLVSWQNAGWQLIDVREEAEWDSANIPGAKLMPMSTFHMWAPSLDPTGKYLFQCHSGRRSQTIAKELQAHQFMHVANLEGGILAYLDAQRGQL